VVQDLLDKLTAYSVTEVLATFIIVMLAIELAECLVDVMRGRRAACYDTGIAIIVTAAVVAIVVALIVAIGSAIAAYGKVAKCFTGCLPGLNSLFRA